MIVRQRESEREREGGCCETVRKMQDNLMDMTNLSRRCWCDKAIP